MRRALIPVLALSLGVVVLGVSCSDDDDGDTEQEWEATLTGAQETPAVTTTATGTAHFEVDSDGDDHIHFEITANNITNLTVGHIHFGIAGQAGPIIVSLISNTPPVSGNREFDGEIEVGDIMQNNNGITTLAQLRTAMTAGQCYVNLHTTQNPTGEIRGQLSETSD